MTPRAPGLPLAGAPPWRGEFAEEGPLVAGWERRRSGCEWTPTAVNQLAGTLYPRARHTADPEARAHAGRSRPPGGLVSVVPGPEPHLTFWCRRGCWASERMRARE